MNSLVFILIRSLKNRLLELRRKPGKLIMYLLVIGIIAALIISSSLQTRDETGDYTDIIWLKGGLFVFLLVMFVLVIKQGLSKGSEFFGMEDVNFLFVSPVNPRTILIYGVVRVMKTVALASIFILFQTFTIGSTFGIGFNGILIIYAGYVLTTAVMQILSMFIYSVTNGKPHFKNIVKVLTFLLFVPFGITVLYHFNITDMLGSLNLILNSSVLSFTPVIGWASAGTIAFITGEYLIGILFFGLLAILGTVLVCLVYFGNPDYFEDVLVASETMFEKKRALAEGNANLEVISDKRIRVKATGIGGAGASAIFHKHVRESFRVNRFGLWGFLSLILIFGAVIFAFFMKQSDTGVIFILLQILMWFQVFLIGTGRGLKETYSHYIYMIPEPPLKKLVWSNIEVILKVTVESVLIFGIAGIITGENVLLILLAISTYSLFSFLLLAVNYLSLRFTGANMNAGFLIILYMLAVAIIMMPGLIGAIFASVLFENWGGIVALIILSIWELLAALICFNAAKGILHNCDMAVIRQTGH